MTELTRRQFLRSAGGITFLALVPLAGQKGIFAAPGTSLPRFTALPYVQPGMSSRLLDGHEEMVIAWQTEAVPADFTVEFGPSPRYGQAAPVTRTERWGGPADTDRRFGYGATMTGLTLSTKYYYRLRGGGQTIAEGYLTTRRKRGERLHFVAFGDNSFGEPGQRAVAYHAYQAHPDIIMNTGDNVYDHGLDSEYAQYFYPIYNADKADPAVGAPLLRSVAFYTVLANHDVTHKDAQHRPAADFSQHRDSLAYYTAMHLPQNGPAPSPTPLLGDPALVADFQACAGTRYPNMANYSFDCGDAHFLCLDSNDYIDPRLPALQQWIAADLSSTDARWKFVVYHHPAFNVGNEHHSEQHMRVISPLLEAHGVDICLHGHEHVYQRTRPLRFAPTDTANADPSHGTQRQIPGTFTVDRKFDGRTHTRPEGIIYITTGAGGRDLYDPGFDNEPAKWLHADDNNVAYNDRFLSSVHSFTVIDVHGDTLTLAQIDETGKERDRIQIIKA